MGVASYGTTADLAAYLPNVDSSANSAVWTTLLDTCSRFIDSICGRYFYNDGPLTKYFDGNGEPWLVIDQDFYSVSALKMAYYENQPLASWLTATGDGVTPGASNFYLRSDGGENPMPYFSSGGTVYRPYNEVEIAQVPYSGAYLPYFQTGRRTVGLTAMWGWPQIPTVIKNLNLKLSARLWHSREGGWADVIGSAETGFQKVAEHWDSEDEVILIDSDYIRKSV